ncbi:MAG: replication initiation factor domain-containing protein [Clostridiales bacterium]|nr:replication initiation factor domain-containing protein [Clostridiales bacterium]
MSVGYFYKKNEEIYCDRRELNLDYLYENDIKYGPTLIDTLTFSFKNFNDSEILSILQPYGFNFSAIMDNGEFVSKGGYERMYICQNTHSTFKCSWIRGCHSEISVLSLTGSACGMLYSNGVMFQFLLDLHYKIKAYGLFSPIYNGDKSFKCTRIDLCKDNFTPFFENLCKDNYGDLSCMFYSQGMVLKPEIEFLNGKIRNGWTLYFGKRNHSSFVRIYDKRTEQKITDERLPYWSRLEFEFKNKDSMLAANLIYFDLVNGVSIDDVFIKHCEKKFFFLTKPWKSEKQCRRDEVAMHPEFKKFINTRWDNQQENLCFANSL